VTGATGPTGAQGNPGVTGATGPKGDQGIQGVTGATGAQGIQGATGANAKPGGSNGDLQINYLATGFTGVAGFSGAYVTYDGAKWTAASGVDLPTGSFGDLIGFGVSGVTLKNITGFSGAFTRYSTASGWFASTGLFAPSGLTNDITALDGAGGIKSIGGIPSGVSGDILATNGSGRFLNVGGVAIIKGTSIFPLASLNSSTSNSYVRVGGGSFDLSRYPATINGLTRTIIFEADIQKGANPTNVQIKLVDATNSADITGTTALTSGNVGTARVASAALTAGTAAGNLRTDAVAQYEVQLLMNGGTPNVDTVYCVNARLAISYA
jgi:hypothetical protein